ncbi:MAG TPA: DNA-formamidopyrimidine glycosylase family protein, partial [Candidatus Polarisedimenticolaceae bacterium]|nr:DNA-formamidopyrimidine glycosylase family protein [Candidatus Polarisedimenticolaceae bacterium]
MPELPDIAVYVEALERLIVGRRLVGVRLGSPFVLRSVAPAPAECVDRRVRSVVRLGKRVVIGLDGETFLIVHLMIAGRLQWKTRGAKLPGRIGLAAFDF